jgi:lipoprotein-anchoring transpeptidase ErfK/SrfK
MAVQTFLDRENYSCNCIDGKAGSRTKQAVLAWEAANGLSPSGEITPELLARVGDAGQYFAVHTVSDEELAALVDVPTTWAGRAEAARLGFETILETLAEKYHCTEGALRTLNPDAAWPDPPVGTRVTVPNPLPASSRRGARAVIRLGVKTVSVYDAGERLVALFPCSIAAKAEKRPVGELKIVTAAADPEYLFDPALFAEDPEARAMKGKRMIAAGPNNPVGVAWISLDRPGYGIHGTPHPEDIGKTESHGCFRLANWNARRLLNMVTAGTPVRVDP